MQTLHRERTGNNHVLALLPGTHFPTQTQPNRKASGWWPVRRNFYSSSFHFFISLHMWYQRLNPGPCMCWKTALCFTLNEHLKWTDILQASPQRVRVQLWRSDCVRADMGGGNQTPARASSVHNAELLRHSPMRTFHCESHPRLHKSTVNLS